MLPAWDRTVRRGGGCLDTNTLALIFRHTVRPLVYSFLSRKKRKKEIKLVKREVNT